MNRHILFRFFDRATTLNEEKRVRQWLESSDVNMDTFVRERKIFDAIMLTSSTGAQKKSIRRFMWPCVSAVASAVIVITCMLLWRTLDHESSPLQYNTIVVPPGQRVNIVLSDETDVWLNANTTFRYPTEFSKNDRTVYLDGEAFFDVRKNEDSPFVVKTSLGDIRATGTSFDLEAYSKHGSFVTSLIDGSVDIYIDEQKLVSLKPNEEGYLENGTLHVAPIDDYDRFLWRNGLIAFNNEPLNNIFFSLEKYFDVVIKFDHKNLPVHTYTGKFRQVDGIDYALNVLQRGARFSYSRDFENNVISIK